jgi:hypothetical protein
MTSHFDAQRWAKLSLYEQMGNIGSEVSRAMNAIRRGDESALEGAYYRGLDLIDATVANSPSEARRREIRVPAKCLRPRWRQIGQIRSWTLTSCNTRWP